MDTGVKFDLKKKGTFDVRKDCYPVSQESASSYLNACFAQNKSVTHDVAITHR